MKRRQPTLALVHRECQREKVILISPFAGRLPGRLQLTGLPSEEARERVELGLVATEPAGAIA